MPYLLALTIVLLPTYAVKFSLFGLSLNLLLVWVFLLWLIFTGILISKKQLLSFFSIIKTIDKKVLLFITLFFFSGLISLFMKGFSEKKFAQFIVLFAQPISLYFISKYTLVNNPKTKPLLLKTCYLLLGVMGVWSIIQYFTLFSLPIQYWGNNVEPKRALGFFGHPNFYSLFSAPLLAFLIPDVINRAKGLGLRAKVFIALWLVGALGLFLSLSRAGWLGLAAAFFIYLMFAADKKIRKVASIIVIIIVIIIATVPNPRYRLLLPFYGEKSAVSRLSLWQTGLKGIQESPFFGLGLTGFSQNWQRLNSDYGLTEKHNFPHNIFLNFWIEMGLLGLISIMGLMGFLIYRGLHYTVIPAKAGIKNMDPRVKPEDDNQKILQLSIALFLIALITQGLIDNPYFKNDLAILFWVIIGLI